MAVQPATQARVSSPVHWLRMVYLGVVWLIVAVFTAQVLFAGLSVFVSPSWWATHIEVGHMMGPLIFAQLILAFVARVPRNLRWLSVLVFALFALQYMYIQFAGLLGIGGLAAMHAVNALFLFYSALTLAQRAWPLRRLPA